MATVPLRFTAAIPAVVLPSDILSGAIGAGLAAVLILLGWLLLRRTKGGSPAVADPDPYASSAGSPLARNILDAITEPFLAVDQEWRLVYANAAAHRFLGFGGTDEIGNDFWRILPQGMESSFRLALLRAPEQRETVTFQTFSDPPGLWLEVSGYPYESGLILSLRDITPRKWAEEKRDRSNASLVHAQALAHVGSWDYEAASDKNSWSDETFRILGYVPGEVQPSLEALLRVVHPEDREWLAAAISAGVQGAGEGTGEITPYEHRVVRPDGEIRYVKGIAQVVPPTPEQPSLVVGAILDITEQRTGEEALRAATEEAQRANQAKSELLSRTSHELRTPLNAILGFGQLLELELEKEENRESVDQILRAGKHLLRLVDEVLDIAQAEDGRLSLHIVPIRPDELVREAVALTAPEATSNGLELRVDYSALSGVEVLGDPPRIMQVLQNLLSNAIKYNREGGLVEVSGQEIDDRLRIAVRDTGVGIGPVVVERLFSPFERGRADEHGIGGSGLGLSLSKSLIESMHGRIGVSSSEGDGSTFWIELPMRSAPEQAELSDDSDEDASGLQGPLVLYVEDNSANVRLVERILARRRPHVRLIASAQGRLAIDLATEHRPDLILLDLNLPDISGLEVLAALQEGEATRRIPVVMVTGEAFHGQAEKLRRLGATAYLTKPFQVPVLLDVVDGIFSEDFVAGATPSHPERT